MKIDTFTAILALLLAAIISYFLSYYHDEENKLFYGICSFLGLLISGVSTIAISYDYSRTTILTRTVSLVFFIIFLGSQLFTLLINFSLPFYVLINGSLIILLMLIVYSISKSKH
jgi:peptidoglycan/LPS O-acetylase OafA/YrhL